MYYVLVTVHVIVCFILIGVVLLQHGKSADLAGAFGGAGSQTAFGPRGAATLLSKMTAICAVIFMITSLSLAIMTSRHISGGSSVMQNVKTTTTAPATSKPQPAPAAPIQNPR